MATVGVEQFFQNGAAQLMHRSLERHLDRFQIQARIRPPGQNAGDDASYLARGLFLDDLREVFFGSPTKSMVTKGQKMPLPRPLLTTAAG